MFINYAKAIIEITATESKAAGRMGSDKFNELQACRRVAPTFAVVVVKSTAKKVDHFKGLTCDYMKEYIEKHPKDIELSDGAKMSALEMFYELRGLDTEGKA